jgi:16S rRNA (guanine966-N2)-methyltransferase
MSILQHDLPGARVLDLFAGSGALGLEALSRGAVRADFVDVGSRSLQAVKLNADRLGAGDAVAIHRADAIRFAEGLMAASFDIAFADPPYDLGLAQRIIDRWMHVPFAAILGVEHAQREEVPPGGDTRRYGDTAITIYRADA